MTRRGNGACPCSFRRGYGPASHHSVGPQDSTHGSGGGVMVVEGFVVWEGICDNGRDLSILSEMVGGGGGLRLDPFCVYICVTRPPHQAIVHVPTHVFHLYVYIYKELYTYMDPNIIIHITINMWYWCVQWRWTWRHRWGAHHPPRRSTSTSSLPGMLFIIFSLRRLFPCQTERKSRERRNESAGRD